MKKLFTRDVPPIPSGETEEERAQREQKEADEESMRIAIFLGMILGCLIGIFMANLELGFPIGIAVCVIIELILKRRRHPKQTETDDSL